MKHELLLQRDRATLVMIDIQERLAGVVPDIDAITRNALKLVKAANILNVPLLVTEHNSRVFGHTIPELRQELQSAAACEKIIFSCFGSDEFQKALTDLKRPQLLLFGLETHICVAQTALDAMTRGFQVHLAEDATSSRHAEDRRVGLDKMHRAGVVPSSSEMAIYEMLERAGTEEFRKVLPIIKA